MIYIPRIAIIFIRLFRDRADVYSEIWWKLSLFLSFLSLLIFICWLWIFIFRAAFRNRFVLMYCFTLCIIVFFYNKFKLQDFICLLIFFSIIFWDINFAIDWILPLNDIQHLAHAPIINLNNLCILRRLFRVILNLKILLIIKNCVFRLTISNKSFLQVKGSWWELPLQFSDQHTSVCIFYWI